MGLPIQDIPRLARVHGAKHEIITVLYCTCKSFYNTIQYSFLISETFF